jgi:hypothetical protein
MLQMARTPGMMFGYEVNEHVKLKILEEREADQLFKLVDSNRELQMARTPLDTHDYYLLI